MKIYSEKTKKEYSTVDECLAAEKEFDDANEKLRLEKEAKAAEKRDRAKEIEDAYTKYREDYAKYIELRNQFIEDYGYFHMTYRDSEDVPEVGLNIFDAYKSIFDRIFNW